MKFLLAITILFLVLQSSCAQSCDSGRYYDEIFPSYDTSQNVTFGSSTSIAGFPYPLTMDIYQPSGDTASTRPLIIWAHGGSFLFGDKSDPDVVALCEHFSRMGYVTASIDYRLGVTLPIGDSTVLAAVYRDVQDMKAAVRFFREDAATLNKYRINPDLIFAGGSSAGAIMADHLTYLDADEIPSNIDTSVWGSLDGDSGNPGYSSDVRGCVSLCGAIGDTSWMQNDEAPLCSMHGNSDLTVPYGSDTVMVFGIPILVVDGSASMAVRANHIGLPDNFYTWNGADHVPYYSDSAYMDTAVTFIRDFLCPIVASFYSSVNDVGNEEYVHVCPNPSSDEFTVDLPADGSGSSTIRLYDVAGKNIRDYKNVNVTLHFGGDLPAGIYLMTIKNNVGIFSCKLVKAE